jgi:hypothetical protein
MERPNERAGDHCVSSSPDRTLASCRSATRPEASVAVATAMNGLEKSDLPIVAGKLANGAALAAKESVERRGGTRENVARIRQGGLRGRQESAPRLAGARNR